MFDVARAFFGYCLGKMTSLQHLQDGFHLGETRPRLVTDFLRFGPARLRRFPPIPRLLFLLDFFSPREQVRRGAPFSFPPPEVRTLTSASMHSESRRRIFSRERPFSLRPPEGTFFLAVAFSRVPNARGFLCCVVQEFFFDPNLFTPPLFPQEFLYWCFPYSTICELLTFWMLVYRASFYSR